MAVARILLLPFAVGINGGVPRLVLHWRPALGPVPGELAVKGGQFKVLAVVDLVRFVVVAPGEEANFLGAAVIQRAQAYRAGMGEHVDGALNEVHDAPWPRVGSHCGCVLKAEETATLRLGTVGIRTVWWAGIFRRG
jgi:hypothetical protein